MNTSGVQIHHIAGCISLDTSCGAGHGQAKPLQSIANKEDFMPTLDWIGKQAVVNHHREVPYRLIHCDSELSVGDPEAGNLLVQGDNLEALRALLPANSKPVPT